MNIKQAKEEIKHTVTAYLKKDDEGRYKIPLIRQRPVLLMGPPGIGKTQIMEQIAEECKIGLVAYTITHHTRQSAVGLPFIKEMEFAGKEYSITEYTMSEIIASVYRKIEEGCPEGILFIDEINCVSETLAPTMLQFLQCKTFGNQAVPEGWIIVAAGNPPEYNKSVRDFDIVTYDRVKRIYIEEDFSAWKEYAYKAQIHGAILSYLEIKKKNFYSIVSDLDGKRFVTARGWEDLSQVMKVYEQLHLPINYDFVVQYLQDDEIAQDFANYYELYNKYKNTYRIPEILEGEIPENTNAIKDAPFDEKLSLLGLLLDRLGQEFITYVRSKAAQEELLRQLGYLRSDLKDKRGRGTELLEQQISAYQAMTDHRKKAGLASREEQKVFAMTVHAMQECLTRMNAEGTGDAKADFMCAKTYFDAQENARQIQIKDTGRHLTNAFDFLCRVFGEGQELVIFLSELSAGYYSLQYVTECGNEAYYKYNRMLLLKDRGNELKEEVMQLLSL